MHWGLVTSFQDSVFPNIAQNWRSKFSCRVWNHAKINWHDQYWNKWKTKGRCLALSLYFGKDLQVRLWVHLILFLRVREILRVLWQLVQLRSDSWCERDMFDCPHFRIFDANMHFQRITHGRFLKLHSQKFWKWGRTRDWDNFDISELNVFRTPQNH